MTLAIIILVILIINYIIKTGAAIITYARYDSKDIQDAVADLQNNMIPNLNRNTYLQSVLLFGAMLAGCIYLLMFITQ